MSVYAQLPLFDQTKQCTKCLRSQPFDQFQRNPRYSGGYEHHCRTCRREYKREWTDRNRERERERYRRARDANPEAARERVRRSHRKHAAKRREYARNWNVTHRERYNQRQRETRQRNRARYAAYDAKRRAQMLRTEIGPVDYEAILAESRGICHLCGEPIGDQAMHFDHIVPLSKGGPHVAANIAVAHARCNQRKHNKVGWGSQREHT
jgi:5-methylcytosine-specific restriction endonuclease McrA